MLDRALNLLRYRLGEFLLRGAFQRVLVMIGLVVSVAVGGGLLAFWLDEGGFAGRGEAIWWAFLRLSDPGYLGDDEGTTRRSISVVLTVAGYVLFLGAMVAIMTQWLHYMVRKLESGLTPIAARGHVVIAGWTDRTVSILREMFLEGGRTSSLWRHRGGRQLAVVLAENASPELHQSLRDRMGDRWRERQIILRQGEPIHLHHLRRVDFANAAAILLPGDPYQDEGSADSDVRIIKIIASISRHALPLDADTPRPFLVAELFDGRREAVARAMYDGPMALVCSDRLVAGLLAQSLRYPRLSVAVRELLFADDQDRLRILPVPEQGLSRTFFEVAEATQGGCLVGVIREGETIVCPPPDLRLGENDRLVVYGPGDAISVQNMPATAAGPQQPLCPRTLPTQRVLVLGWTRRVPALIADLAGSTPHLTLEVLSTVPTKEREQDLIGAPVPRDGVVHHRGDFTIPRVLQSLDLKAFDAVVLVGSDRLESGSESDARSLAGLAALRTLVAPAAGPRVMVELMDAENATVVEDLHAEFIVAPMVVGRVLAQVALTPRLSEVFDDLFAGGGGEVVVVSPSLYGDDHADLSALRSAVFRAGHLPMGVLDMAGTLLPFEQADADDCESLVVVHRVDGQSPPSVLPPLSY